MSARISNQIRSNLVGYVALWFALTGGTAYAIDGSLAGQGTVGSADIINVEVVRGDIADNTVNSARIVDGTVGTPDLEPNSVGWCCSVARNALTAADIDQSTLNGAAIPFREAQIHAVTGLTFCNPFSPCLPFHLLPGLRMFIGCVHDALGVTVTTDAAGTANAMIVASGVDPGPSTDGDFNVKNFSSAQGTVLHPTTDGDFSAYWLMNDETGFANAETRFVIDAGDKTYSIALHSYHRATVYPDGPYAHCETFGTATMAG